VIKVVFALVSLAISLNVLTAPLAFAETANPRNFSSIATIGKPAPNFELSDYKGDQHSLSDYKGKFVVLEWINFVCPFSRKHYESGNMPTLQKEYVKKGVVWLSINSSALDKQGNFSADKIKEELKAYKASPTAYLVDPDGHVGRLYGAKTTPDMYVINPRGVLIYKGAIDDKPTADKDDIPDAKNYVKAALDEAIANKPVTITETKSYGCSVKYAD
jgi:peroxiredoxin